MNKELTSTIVEPEELDITVPSQKSEDDETNGGLDAIARPIDDELIRDTAETIVTGYSVVHTGSRKGPDVSGAVGKVVGDPSEEGAITSSQDVESPSQTIDLVKEAYSEKFPTVEHVSPEQAEVNALDDGSSAFNNETIQPIDGLQPLKQQSLFDQNTHALLATLEEERKVRVEKVIEKSGTPNGSEAASQRNPFSERDITPVSDGLRTSASFVVKDAAEDGEFTIKVGASSPIDGKEAVTRTLTFADGDPTVELSATDQDGQAVTLKKVGDNTWEVPNQSVTLTGKVTAKDWSGELSPTLSEFTQDEGAAKASSAKTQEMSITITPDAADATVEGSASTGTESKEAAGATVPLNLKGEISDTDGSETFTQVVFENVPEEWTLKAGEALLKESTPSNGVKTVTWTPGDADSVTTLPEFSVHAGKHVSGHAKIQATVHTQDAEKLAEKKVTLPVTITPVVDAVDMTASSSDPISVSEGEGFNLPVSVRLVDLTETLAVHVTGLPEGTIIRDENGHSATANADGTASFDLSSGEPLTQIHVEPPVHYSGKFTPEVTVTATDTEERGRDTVEKTFSPHKFDVTISPDADDVSVTASNISEQEDNDGNSFPLNMDIQLSDTDGSEGITQIVFKNVPQEWTLKAGKGSFTGNNSTSDDTKAVTWTPSPKFNDSGAVTNVPSFTVSLPEHASTKAPVSLQAVVHTKDQGSEGHTDTKQTPVDFTVNVKPVSDGLLTSASFVVKDAAEDGEFTIEVGASSPIDGKEAVTRTLTFADGDPTVELSAVNEGGAQVDLTRDTNGNYIIPNEPVTITGKVQDAHWSGKLQPTLSELTQDEGAAKASSAKTQEMSITITPDAADATVEGSASTGTESKEAAGATVPLNLKGEISDTDGSETFTQVVFENVPEEWTLKAGEALLTESTPSNGVKTVTWTPGDADSVTTLPEFSVHAGKHVSGYAEIQATVHTQDAEKLAEKKVTLPVTITPVVDAVDMTASSSDPISVSEGEGFNLPVSVRLVDLTETLAVHVTGLPEGTIIRDENGHSATANADGTASFDLSSGEPLTQIHVEPPVHYSGKFTPEVTVTATDTEERGRDTVEKTFSPHKFDVTISPDADDVSVTASNISEQEDNDGNSFPLNMDIQLSDTDGSEGITQIVFKNVPQEWTLKAGKGSFTGNNSTSDDTKAVTWTPSPKFNDSGAVTNVPSFTVSLPEHASTKAPVSLQAVVHTKDQGSEDHTDTKQTPVDFTVNVKPVSDGLRIPASFVVKDAAEDGEFTIEVGASSPIDGKEAVTRTLTFADGDPTVELSAVNEGGAQVDLTRDTNGNYIIPNEPVTITGKVQDAHWSGKLQPTLSEFTQDEGAAKASSAKTQEMSITITPDAADATVEGSASTGTESKEAAGATVPLNLKGEISDTDGSETFTQVVFENVPEEWTLKAGEALLKESTPSNGVKTVTWTPGDADSVTTLPEFSVHAGKHVSGYAEIQATVHTQDAEKLAEKKVTLPVTITPVVDAIDTTTFGTEAISVSEGEGFNLPVSVSSVDPTETLAVHVTDLPEGTIIKYGNEKPITANADGTASFDLPPKESLTQIYVEPPVHYSGKFTPKVTVTATDTEERGRDTVEKTFSPHNFDVTISPDADDVSVTASNISEQEDNDRNSFLLKMDIQLSDTDGSEGITQIVFKNVPQEWTLKAGKGSFTGNNSTSDDTKAVTWTPPSEWTPQFDADGTVTNIPSFSVSLPEHASTKAPVSLQAVVHTKDQGSEGHTDTKQTPVDFTVNVTPVSDGVEPGTPFSVTGAAEDGTFEEDGEFTIEVGASSPIDGKEAVTRTLTFADGDPTVELSATDQDGQAVTLKKVGNTWEVPNQSVTLTGKVTAKDWSGELSPTLSELTQDEGAAKASSAKTQEMSITITPDAADATVEGSASTGTESKEAAGATVPLNLKGEISDTDGSETFTQVVFENVPEEWTLKAGEALLTESTPSNGVKTVTWTPGDADSVTTLPEFSVHAGKHVSGYAEIQATVHTQDAEKLAEKKVTLPVTITPVVDAIDTTTFGTEAISVSEGEGFNLPVSVRLVDLTETLAVHVTGLPEGTIIGDENGHSATANADGTASFDLPPKEPLTQIHVEPPVHYSGKFTPKVTVTATDTEERGRDTVEKTFSPHNFDVTITPDADDVSVTASNISEQEDNDRNSFLLKMDIQLSDTDGSEGITQIVFKNVPQEWTLKAGKGSFTGNNSTSDDTKAVTWTPPSEWTPQFDADGTVTNIPSFSVSLPEHASTKAPVSLQAVVHTKDQGSEGHTDTKQTPVDFTVNVTPVSDGVEPGTPFSVTGAAEDGTFEEDGEFTIKVGASSPIDGKEAVTRTLTFADGDPTVELSATDQDGQAVTLKKVGNTWEVPNQSVTLTGKVTAKDWSGELSPTLSELTQDEGAAKASSAKTQEMSITITPDAADATVEGSASTGTESKEAAGATVPLNLKGEISDTDGSETFTQVVFENVPEEWTLKAGEALLTESTPSNGVKTVTWTPGDADSVTTLPEFSVHAGKHVSGYAEIQATVHTQDAEKLAEKKVTLPVTITPVVDAIDTTTFGTEAISVSEGEGFNLPVSVRLVDLTETLAVHVTGLPEGTIIGDENGHSATANADGTASFDLPPKEPLTQIHVEPPVHYSGKFTPKVTVTATDTEERGRDTVEKTFSPHNFDVTITPDADDVSVTASNISEQEDNDRNSFLLKMDIQLSDTDGSEGITQIVFKNVPQEWTLKAGKGSFTGNNSTSDDTKAVTWTPPSEWTPQFDADGTVTNIPSFSVSLPEHASTKAPVSLQAVVHTKDQGSEGHTDTKQTPVDFTVNVTPVSDGVEPGTPFSVTGAAEDGTFEEDGEFTIKVGASSPIDGKEAVTRTLTFADGDPTVELSATDQDGQAVTLKKVGNTWEVPNQSVTLTGKVTAKDWSGELSPTLSELTQDEGAAKASSAKTQSKTVTITPDADDDINDLLVALPLTRPASSPVGSGGSAGDQREAAHVRTDGEEYTGIEGKQIPWDPEFILENDGNADTEVTRITMYSSDQDFADSTWFVGGHEVKVMTGNYEVQSEDSSGHPQTFRHKYKIEIPEGAISYRHGKTGIRELQVMPKKDMGREEDIEVLFDVETQFGNSRTHTYLTEMFFVNPEVDEYERFSYTISGEEDYNGSNTFSLGTITIRHIDNDRSEHLRSVSFNFQEALGIVTPEGDILQSGTVYDLYKGSKYKDLVTVNSDGSYNLTGFSVMFPPHYSSSGSVPIWVAGYSVDTVEERKYETDPAHRWAGDIRLEISPITDEPVIQASPVYGQEDEWAAVPIYVSSPDNDGSEEVRAIVSDLPAGTQVRYRENGELKGPIKITDDNHTVEMSAEAAKTLEVKMPENFKGRHTATIKAVSSERAEPSDTKETTQDLPMEFAGEPDGVILFSTSRFSPRDPSRLEQEEDSQPEESYQMLAQTVQKPSGHSTSSSGSSLGEVAPGSQERRDEEHQTGHAPNEKVVREIKTTERQSEYEPSVVLFDHEIQQKDGQETLSLVVSLPGGNKELAGLPPEDIIPLGGGRYLIPPEKAHLARVVFKKDYSNDRKDELGQVQEPDVATFVFHSAEASGRVLEQTAEIRLRAISKVNEPSSDEEWEKFLPVSKDVKEGESVRIYTRAKPLDSDGSERVTGTHLVTEIQGYDVYQGEALLVWNANDGRYVQSNGQHADLSQVDYVACIPREEMQQRGGHTINYRLDVTVEDSGQAEKPIPVERSLRVLAVADTPEVEVSAEPDSGSNTFAYVSIAAMSGETVDYVPSQWDTSESVFLVISDMPPGAAFMVLDQEKNAWVLAGRSGAENTWILDANTLDAYRQEDRSIPDKTFAFVRSQTDQSVTQLKVRAVAVEKQGEGSDRIASSDEKIVEITWPPEASWPRSSGSSSADPEPQRQQDESDDTPRVPPEPSVTGQLSGAYIEGQPVSLESVHVGLKTGSGPLDSSSKLSSVIVIPLGFQPFETGVDEDARLPEGVAWYRQDVLTGVDTWGGVDVADLPNFMKDENGHLIVRSYSLPADKVDQFEVRSENDHKEAQNHSGSLPMKMRAVLTQQGRSDVVDEKDFKPNLDPVADGFELKSGADQGQEDQRTDLKLSAELLDSKEEIVSLVLKVVKPVLLKDLCFVDSEGVVLKFDNGGISESLSPERLAGLALEPSRNFSGDVPFVVEGLTKDGDKTKLSDLKVEFSVKGSADEPTLHAAFGKMHSETKNITVQEDEIIPFRIDSALQDNDGSEKISTLVTGMQPGSVLLRKDEGGNFVVVSGNCGNGEWAVSQAEIAASHNQFYIRPPKNFSGRMEIDVKTTAWEGDGSFEEGASKEEALHATVEPVVDEPQITVSPVSGQEDMWSRFDYKVTPGDADGSESIVSVKLKAVNHSNSGDVLRFSVFRDGVREPDLPIGSDGFVTVDRDDLDFLEVAAQDNRHGAWDVTSQITVRDGSAEKTFGGPETSVTITSVADGDYVSQISHGYDPEGRFVHLKGGVSSQSDDDETFSYAFKLPENVKLGYLSSDQFQPLDLEDQANGFVKASQGFKLYHLQLQASDDRPYTVQWKAYSNEGDGDTPVAEGTLVIGGPVVSGHSRSRRDIEWVEGDSINPQDEKTSDEGLSSNSHLYTDKSVTASDALLEDLMSQHSSFGENGDSASNDDVASLHADLDHGGHYDDMSSVTDDGTASAYAMVS